MTAAPIGYTLFDTGIGRCGLAWGEKGVVAVQLPDTDDGATVARLTERLAGAEASPPPESVAAAIAAIVALIDGPTGSAGDAAARLSTIELDLSAVPPFHRRVYQLARAIPPGQTLSYGEVAARLGSPGGARAVGQALRRNPFAVVVPCHRVVAAGGRLGGFSAPGGLATKTELLAREASPGGDEPRGPESPTADPALGFDPAVAGEHLRGADPVLGVLMDEVGPPQLRLTGAPTTFAALARSIVYQQLHGRAAAAIYGRLCALFPDSGAVLTPGDVNGATDEMLLGAGLSRAKMRSLRDLALRTTEGAVPTLDEAAAMDDEAIVEELSQVRGIGRWSAEMFLIFTLGRPDVLPTGDYGVRKGFAVTYRNGVMPTPKELLAFGERWRPYRSLASWYLWRALELAPDVTPVGPAAPVRAARPVGRAGPAARRP